MTNVLDDFMVGLSNCDKVVVRLTGVGEREFSTKEIYEAIDKLQQPTLKPTTEINSSFNSTTGNSTFSKSSSKVNFPVSL